MKTIKNNLAETVLIEFIEMEVLYNEKLRSKIIVLLGIILLSLFTLARIIWYDNFRGYFPDDKPFVVITGLYTIFLLRQIFIKFYIDHKIRKKSKLIYFQRIGFPIIEVTIPSLGILLLANSIKSPEVLTLPSVFLYFVFIMLTILSLDFKISSVAGIVAGVQYLLLSIFIINNYKSAIPTSLLNTIPAYFGTSMFFVLSGFVAGKIGSLLKERIYNSYSVLEEMNKIINLFGQQISQEIVDDILNNSNKVMTKKKDVCIMFLDIRGFTKFCEGKTPEDIIEYQNNIFGFMINIITEQKGIINQFLGDGYMATFGAPISYQNDSLNAVTAARKILYELKIKNETGTVPFTKIGIGLHFGEAVVGNVGNEIRNQYSITGNVVITASRIQELNKIYNSQLLISKEVFDQISEIVKEYELLGDVSIRGREKPITLYKLE